MLRLAVLATLVVFATAEYYPTKFGLYTIESWDGTKLKADADVATPRSSSEKIPLVIFINSWGVPQIEYLLKTVGLAKRGYVALEYEARGFYGSGGEIGTAGPDDVKDVSAVIDWALKKWPQIDPERIAMGGISYGAGLSLLGAAADPRVKAVVAMSGWASLVDAMYWHESPALVWSSLLDVAGKMTGKVPPILNEMLHDLLTHQNISGVIAWGNQRSPRTFLEKLNARKVPIFISNNMEDNLFHSNFQLEFWEQIEGPKRLCMNQGTHAEAEMSGLLDVPNHIWIQAMDWFDHFLRGKDNGIERPPLVTWDVEGILKAAYKADTWPPTSGFTRRAFYLSPKTGKFGSLTAAPANATSLDSITYSTNNEMTTGVPLISAAISPYKPIKANFRRLNAEAEIVFLSESMREKTRVCGNIEVQDLWVLPTQPRFQVYAYAYSYDPSELVEKQADLMAHSPVGMWDGVTPGTPVSISTMTFRTTCYDIPKGHHLAVGFNMHNVLYEPSSKNGSVAFMYSKNPKVILPIVE